MKIGRKVLGILAVLAISAVVVSAGLLTYYGKVETTANVKQSVVIKKAGGEWKPYDDVVDMSIGDVTGGDTVCKTFYIKNRASQEAPVYLSESIPNGVTTSYHLTNMDLHDIEWYDAGEDTEDYYGGDDTRKFDIVYDCENDEYRFEFPSQAYLLAIDTDGNGWYNWQMDVMSSEIPDLWYYTSSGWIHEFEYKTGSEPDYTITHDGIGFDGQHTITVPAEKLGEKIKVMGDIETSYGQQAYIPGKSTGDSSSLFDVCIQPAPGTEFILPENSFYTTIVKYEFDMLITEGDYTMQTWLMPN